MLVHQRVAVKDAETWTYVTYPSDMMSCIVQCNTWKSPYDPTKHLIFNELKTGPVASWTTRRQWGQVCHSRGVIWWLNDGHLVINHFNDPHFDHFDGDINQQDFNHYGHRHRSWLISPWFPLVLPDSSAAGHAGYGLVPWMEVFFHRGKYPSFT